MQFRTTASTAYKSTIEGLGRIEFGLENNSFGLAVFRRQESEVFWKIFSK